jgi:hypothetical protein
VSFGPGANGITDTSVAKRATYHDRVTALNALGESVTSTEVHAVAR